MKKELLALLATGKTLVECAKELKVTEDECKKMLAPEPPTADQMVADITNKVTANVTEALKALIPAPAAAAKIDAASQVVIPAGNDAAGTAAPTVTILRGKTLEEKDLPASWREIGKMLTAAKNRNGSGHVGSLDMDMEGDPEGLRQAGLQMKAKGLHKAHVPANIMKAGMDGAAGGGYEWVPQDYSSSLYTRLQGYAAVVPRIRQSVMTRASQTIGELTTPVSIYGSPVTGSSDYPTANAYQGEAADKPTTTAITIYANRIVAKVDIYDDMASDSLFNLLQEIQINAARMLGLAADSMVINGDTTATHMDNTGTTLWGTKAPEFLAKGLRYYALNGTGLKQDLSTGGITVQNLGLVKKLLGKYARINPEDCAWIFGSQGLGALECLSDFTALYASGSLWTQNQGYGPAKILGLTPIYSTGVPENLNASGVYDGTTKTKGTLLCANLNEFLFGVRRQMSFEIQRYADLAKNVLNITLRAGFAPFETPGSTVTSVSVGYNYNA